MKYLKYKILVKILKLQEIKEFWEIITMSPEEQAKRLDQLCLNKMTVKHLRDMKALIEKELNKIDWK